MLWVVANVLMFATQAPVGLCLPSYPLFTLHCVQLSSDSGDTTGALQKHKSTGNLNMLHIVTDHPTPKCISRILETLLLLISSPQCSEFINTTQQQQQQCMIPTIGISCSNQSYSYMTASLECHYLYSMLEAKLAATNASKLAPFLPGTCPATAG